MIFVRSALAVVLTSAVSSAAAQEAPVAAQTAALVYGSDDRRTE